MATLPLPKNSILIQQLCKHIATLEETNAKLHQQLAKADSQHQFVCKFYRKNSWKNFLENLMQQQQKSKSVALPPDFQDTASTFKSKDDNLQFLTVLEHSPLRQQKNKNSSAFQSPIQSQSRLLNKSIRGQTDRQKQDQNNQDANHSFGQQRTKDTKNFRQQNLLFTLSELNIKSIQKQNLDLKSTQQENMVLSIQNTKLRQKVAKLEAILSSHVYK